LDESERVWTSLHPISINFLAAGIKFRRVWTSLDTLRRDVAKKSKKSSLDFKNGKKSSLDLKKQEKIKFKLDFSKFFLLFLAFLAASCQNMKRYLTAKLQKNQ
jgi:hypothetical protein